MLINFYNIRYTRYSELICSITLLIYPPHHLQKHRLLYGLGSKGLTGQSHHSPVDAPNLCPIFVSWLANSSDLSPVDCHLWSMMHARVYQTPVWDVTDLRQRLIDTWNSLSDGECRRRWHPPIAKVRGFSTSENFSKLFGQNPALRLMSLGNIFILKSKCQRARSTDMGLCTLVSAGFL